MPRWKRSRTSQGLLPQQEEFLVALRKHGDWNLALAEVGFQRRRVWRWLREDEEFQKACDEIYGNAPGTARTLLEYGTMESVATLMDAQAAKKPIKVTITCSECGAKNETFVTVDDWGARLKAVEMMLKGGGVLKERKQVDINITQLTIGESTALALLAKNPNANVPPLMLRKFREMGLLPEGRGEEVVDAEEVREVD